MADPTVTPRPQRASIAAWRKTGVIPPYVVFACASVFFWSLSLRTLIWTLMPAIATDLRLSSSLAGLAISAILFGNNLGTWSAGWLPGSRHMRILVSAFLLILAAVVFSTSADLWSLIASGFVLGVVGGIYLPLGLATITDAGGESRKALYVSVQEVLASIASFAGATFVAVALDRAGWRTSTLMWCVVGAVAVIVFSRARKVERRSRPARSREPLRPSWVLVYCCIGFAASSVLIGGLISVLPLIMVRGWGVDPAEAASVVGYTRLAGLLGNAIVGLRADRWGHVRVLQGLQFLALVGATMMPLGGYGPLFMTGLLAVAVGAAGMVTVLPAAIASAFPPGHREQAMAISIGAGGMVGSVLAPALFGVLVDLGLPTLPMMISAGLALLAVAVTGRIPTKPARASAEPGTAPSS